MARPTSSSKSRSKKRTTNASKSSNLKQKDAFIEHRRTLIKSLLARRPHRSFKMTRRRDYVRELELPGYISFTSSVIKQLCKDKWLLTRFVALSMIVSGVIVGLASQLSFAEFVDSMDEQGGELLSGGWGGVARIGLLFVAGTSGHFNTSVSETQQIYAVIIGLLTWLVTVWLLRAQLAGNKPKLRDGLYNAGSPIVATFLLFLLFLVQLVPLAISVIMYTTAGTTGILENPLLSIVVFFLAITLVVLSLYLITSTLLALVIVTLPGMYPWHALRSASDLVIGRRSRILYRLLWCFVVTLLAWIVVLAPILFISYLVYTHFEQLSWMPIVPIALLLMSSITAIFVSAYIYLLYRKVVDSDTK
jgi:hypothetical protein